MKTRFCIVGILLIITVSSGAQVCFKPAVSYPVDTAPLSVVSADFNNDGKIDLATANAGSGSVSILLGNGSGGFSAETGFAVGGDPWSVISADFNGDGNVDLATANVNAGNISVLLGDGLGGFSTANHFSGSSSPYSIVSADFNGDSKLDLAIVGQNNYPNTLSILIGNGLGSFNLAGNFNAGYEPKDVISADFNNDGKADLAVANRNYNVNVLLGDGAGSFGSAIICGMGGDASGVISADFNGDAKMDLAAINHVSNIAYVFLGDGAGGFNAGTIFPAGSSPTSIISADFNGDTKPDLAISDLSSLDVSVLLGNGAGSFGAINGFTASGYSESLSSADFNGDGKVDLAVSDGGSNNVSVLLGCLIVNTSSADVSCFGGNNGNATATIENGPMPYSYLWSTTPPQTTQVATGLTAGNYSVTGTDANNAATTVTLSISQPQALSINHSSVNSSCYNNGGTTNITINGGTVPYTYLWSNGSTTKNISGIGGGTYSITVIDNNGCAFTDTIIIHNSIAPNPALICLVTVDSASQNNIIIWDKTSFTDVVDSFIIYREITSNNYKQIGAVPFDSLSLFVDTLRAKYFPNSGNPNLGSYRYKIQVRDTCGNFSALSPYHNSVFTINSSGNFSWNLYDIEGSSNPVNAYTLMRDDNNNGNWHAINSVAGTQTNITDPAFSTYQSTGNWRVETQWGISCTPTIKSPDIFSLFNTSLSNLYKASISSASEILLKNMVNIDPNPSSAVFTVACERMIREVDIYNLLGENVCNIKNGNQLSKIEINFSEKVQGIYFARIKTSDGIISKKIVVAR